MGAEGLRALGYAERDIEETAEEVRQRDEDRLSEQVQEDDMSGRDRLVLQPAPEPLSKAASKGRPAP